VTQDHQTVFKEGSMVQQESVENVYLEEVLQKQAEVDRKLQRKRAPAPMYAASGAPAPAPPGGGPEVEDVTVGASGRAVSYRITGFGPWRDVVVPPNVYVVHTRRGHEAPLHIGLGISFRFRPRTDAFLVIPSAVQTLLINANCICRERQGILVQAYVQWIIDDIEIAYRKLDFSDPADPMGLVNLQLREQAEAAIKDKVATMSIDAVLSDKQPIIEELTRRLRDVAEGSRSDDGASGLGLKIVTVQIKEAVVSSARVWENLQTPFRAERRKMARLAELEGQQEIAKRELENRRAREEEELHVEAELAELRAQRERERYDREQAEEARRHTLEQEAERQALAERNATAKAHNEAELELAVQALELEQQRIATEIQQVQARMQLDEAAAKARHAEASAQVQLDEMQDLAEVARKERELILLNTRREIENDLSPRHLQAQLVARLPEIAEHLPAPDTQRTTIVTGGAPGTPADTLTGFLTHLLTLIEDTLSPT
jgi:hypothetical protein